MTLENVVFDSDSLDWRRQHPGGDFDVEVRDISDKTPLEKLGFRAYRLKPGKKAWPFHAHLANEEMIFIQEGEGTLRFGEEEYSVSAGDCLSFPTGPEYAHQLINTSDEDLYYLCVSTMIEPDAMVYPDSNKLGVFSGDPPGGDSEKRDFSGFFDMNASRDYWDGEIPEDEN